MRKLVSFLSLLSLFFFFFFFFSAPILSAHSPATVKVGVIMDLTTPVGRGSLAALSLAHSDFYASIPSSPARLLLLPRSSPRSDAVDAASAALDLISNHQVAAILGPQTSSSTAFVANLAARASVPVISFSATSSSLSPSLSPFFIRAAPSDAAMGPVIASLASAFSWRRLVPVYEDSDFGASLIPNLVDALAASGDSRIPYRCAIPPTASDDRISSELYKLKTLQTRVFILHAPSALAARILSAAVESGMTESGYAWILTSAVAGQLGSIDPVVILDSMQGDIGVRPFIERTKRVREFENRWRHEFLKQNPNLTAEIVAADLSPFIYYAYDAFWAVATAANAVIAADPAVVGTPHPASERSGTVLAEISKIGVSDIGPKLLKSVQETEFDGMGGRFRLVNGELNVSAFQIVNVNGESAPGIGFWTPAKGLTKKLNSSGDGYYLGLEPVIWPGKSTAAPKGWEMPTGGKKMKFLVPGPVDPGFHSFLRVDKDPVTGELDVGGYVIEIFEASVRRLPYALPYEFSMVNKTAEGKNTVNYNDLVNFVYDQEADGVVGDVTITSGRSENASFTFPYTASGVSMLVPVRDVHSHRAWIFLKPLTADLWLVSCSFFILTGVVVWFLEHRINPDFRGPPAHQLGTVFYFSFSTLVFAHREKIMSNLSKLVMTIWVFVVLILTSSYTASLTSMLTVRKFQPSITNIQELIDTRKNVGYLRHSFVKGLLISEGFTESQLYGYKSPEEYKDALSNGTVAAIIDEIPYLKLFLKSFCDNFTMSNQLYKTSGFGFVFPKGSSLATDMSRAILNLTESDEMVEIERRWFGDQSSCPNQGSSSISTSNSLDFNSFYGLFLITGGASVLALLIYAFSFCYRYRHSLAAINAEEKPLKKRLSSIASLYDEKDLSSHTFNRSGDAGGHISAGTSPQFKAAAGSQSPISLTLGTDTPPSPEFLTPQSGTPRRMSAAAIEEMITPARNS